MSFQGMKAQDSLNILRSRLDFMDQNDPQFIEETINYCEIVLYTEQSHQVPEYGSYGLKEASIKNDTASLVKLHSLIGDYYWRAGLIPESAEEFNQIRILAEESKNPDWQALSFNGLGTIYYLMEDYEVAAEYYKSGLSTLKKDTALRIRLFNNTANVLTMLNQMDSAIYYYKLALEYDLSKQDYRKMSISYMNLALAYDRMNDSNGARSNLVLAEESAKRSKVPHQLAYVYGVMADFISDRHPSMSATLYKESLKQASAARSYDLILDAFRNLSEYYVQNGRLDSAFYYTNRSNELHDSLKTVHENKTIGDVEASYAWAKTKIKIELEKQKNELDLEVKSNRQRTALYVLLIVVGALGVILFVLFHTNLVKGRINKELEGSNKVKDRFLSLMAHDLRSPISGAIGLSEIIEDEGKEIVGTRLPQYAKALNTTLRDVKDLIENLLQWAQTESGKMAFNPEPASLKQVADDAISLLQDISFAKGIVIQNHIGDDLIFKVDSNMFSTIFRNLVSNAIKHTETGGVVSVSSEFIDDVLNIVIEDTGTGIPPDRLKNLFNEEHVFTTPGTRNERGIGLGLLMCKDFVEQHFGTIEVDSELGKGTKVIITLPLL